MPEFSVLPEGEPTPAPTTREARREAIIAIAKEAFFADGYAATSMASIAAKLGGSKATLYNYFPSKEQLFEAVAREFTQRGAAQFEAVSFTDGDFRAALTRFGVLILRHMLSDDAIAMYRLIAAEATRFPEIGEAYYRAVLSSGKQRLIGRFEAAMMAGHIRHTDPAIAAAHFFELCMSDLHRHRLWNIGAPPTDEKIVANIDHAVTAFLDGYRAKAPSLS